MTTIEPPPPQPQTAPNRVTVVDFDMPFGSMIAFMLKWAIAAIPAMLILIIFGTIVSVVFAGLIAGFASTASLFPRRAEQADAAVASSTPALVVTMRPTANGWQVTSDSSVAWRNCSLSIDGHSVNIPTLSGSSPVEFAASAFSNGGLPQGAAVTERGVSMFCRLPERQVARIYLLQ